MISFPKWSLESLQKPSLACFFSLANKHFYFASMHNTQSNMYCLNIFLHVKIYWYSVGLDVEQLPEESFMGLNRSILTLLGKNHPEKSAVIQPVLIITLLQVWFLHCQKKKKVLYFLTSGVLNVTFRQHWYTLIYYSLVLLALWFCTFSNSNSLGLRPS